MKYDQPVYLSSGMRVKNLDHTGLPSTASSMFSSPIVISEAMIPSPKEQRKRYNYYAENHGTSASSALGEELPRNIQDLLKGYFKAKKLTVVPPEIYCIQSHRVYTTIDGKKAVYQCHRTGEHVEVRAYSLPTMKHKNNHRLLVAVGRASAQPIVLARTKPHSNEFREWLGAPDDGTTAPVITRSIPDHGLKVGNKRQKISTGAVVANRLKALFNKEDEADSHDLVEDLIPVQIDDDTIMVDHGIHEPVGQSIERRVSRNRLAYTIEDDDEDTAESSPEPAGRNGHASSPLSTSRQSRNLVDSAQQRRARNKGRTTSRVSTPRMTDISSDLLPQTTPTVAENTIFYFISALTGEKVRKRALAKVDNVEVLFTHVYAADAIPNDSKGKKLAALEVRVGDFGEAIRIVDDEDFGALVDAIVREDCWEQGMGCEVFVTGLGGQDAA